MTTNDYRGHMTGRPASTSTRIFSRRLAPAQIAILAAAGDGDISAGFHNLLSLYQRLYALGYRNDDCFFDNISKHIITDN